jgi:hypothetical protein
MKLNKTIKIIILLIIILNVKYSFAYIIVTGASPYEGGANQVNIDSATFNLINSLRNYLLIYQRQPKLLRGFTKANIYSSQASTQQSYNDYDLFAISVGTMIGTQGKKFDLDYYKDINNDLFLKGDLNTGASLVLPIFQAGLNLKIIGLNNFYLGG